MVNTENFENHLKQTCLDIFWKILGTITEPFESDYKKCLLKLN